MNTDLPTFAVPFAFDGGQAVVNEQDTLEDVAACVFNVVSCPQGARPDQPDFGIPELLFETLPVPTAELEGAIANWEPRAELDATQVLTPPDAVTIVQAVQLKENNG